MTWQLIETAPKDETPILAFNGDTITTINWLYDEWSLIESGKWAESLEYYPTHWMPLPPPPAINNFLKQGEMQYSIKMEKLKGFF